MDDAQLAQVLRHHHVNCTQCGYDLHGVTGGHCPECGLELSFRVLLSPTRRFSHSWLAGVIALATCLPESWHKWQRLVLARVPFYGEQFYTPTPELRKAWDWSQPEISLLNPWFVGSTLFWGLLPVYMIVLVLLRRRVERLPFWGRWMLGLLLVIAALVAQRRQFYLYYELFGPDRLWHYQLVW